MFKFLIGSIVLLGSVFGAHDFFAEQNFICELCKTLNTFEHESNLKQIFDYFPMMKRLVPESFEDIK